MRARLARSERPERIFEVALEAAHAAGLRGSSPGARLDRRCMTRSRRWTRSPCCARASVACSRVAGEREAALRALLRRDDDYASGGKPACDWEDPAAREALIDAIARRCHRAARARSRASRSSRRSPRPRRCSRRCWARTSRPMTTGTFRIARRVAPDRVISHGRCRRPPRPQDERPQLRRLQGPRRARPRQRARHRHRRHAGQRG